MGNDAPDSPERGREDRLPRSRLPHDGRHHPPSVSHSVPAALTGLGIKHALVYGAIEGSDEASLDGTSSLVRVRNGETEEFRVSPDSVGLSQATRADILGKSVEDEASHSIAALEGEAGPVKDLILSNAALGLWTADGDTSLAG